MAKETLVELVPLQRIVRKESAEAKEVVYTPGPDAESFEVPESEAERLIRKGYARRADEAEEGSEEDGDEGEGAPTEARVATKAGRKKSGGKKDAPAGDNPSLVTE